ncbi:MAG: hypothetical protein JWR18_1862 [Segetibacter sp.]|nr:hypothetical protein [Segetibacter sp.]
MKAPAIPNSDERELRRYRQFYMIYPAADHLIADNNQIRELLPPELMRVELELLKRRTGGRYRLEQALLDHLLQFLLELDKGFCFEARQKA